MIRGRLASLARPHDAGLEGGSRVVCVVVATLLIATGLLHVSAAGDHTNLPLMMVGFLIVATVQVGLGGLLLFRRPGRLLVAAGALLTVAALGTWVVSRTAGLPFLPGGHMEPIGAKDGVTVLFEAMTLPLLALLASRELDRVRLPSARLGSQAVAVVGAAIFALLVPGFVLGGGEHHSATELAAHADGVEGHAHDAADLEDAAGVVHGSSGHSGSASHHDPKAGGAAGGNDGSGHGSHAEGRRASEDLFAAVHPDGGDHARRAGRDGADDGHAAASRGSAASGHSAHGAGGPSGSKQQEGKGGSGHGASHPGSGGDDDAGHGDGHPEEGEGSHEHDDSAATGQQRSIAVESGHEGGDGERPQGPAVVVHDQPDEERNGSGHDHAPCDPTARQQAAADVIVEEVRAELRQYENNPAAAIEDGFDYVFGPTDRMLHVVHLERVRDPDVLNASEIESIVYYMTDTGWVPIAGMFIMPEYGMSGPQPGGCLTQWHHHGGIIGRWATAGTSADTPEMMHVFTYPGLDPWGHYSGRELASLWTPGRWAPSVCRESGDANDGCLP